jgi:hypothetical protein
MFELFLSLYVDDGSFMFKSKDDLKKGPLIMYHHMKRFGLLMHILVGMEVNQRRKPSSLHCLERK